MLALAACLANPDDLTYYNRVTFFRARRDSLETLANDLEAYGRIQEMSGGLRYFKSLNGDLVAYDSAAVNTAVPEGVRPTLPLATVLDRDSIPDPLYQGFRTRLEHLRFIQVYVTPDYTAFVYDGFLDNLNGLMRMRPGHPLPTLRTEFADLELSLLVPLGDGWFYFETT